jgi:predicted dinucleotide-binding enzyme
VVPDALASVTGLPGKVVLDATNRVGVVEHFAPAGYASIAEYVKAQTGGPTAKAFNLNFGNLLDQAATASSRPNNIWVGDEGARAAVEQLSRDIGMEPLNGGPLENAAIEKSSPGCWWRSSATSVTVRSSTGLRRLRISRRAATGLADGDRRRQRDHGGHRVASRHSDLHLEIELGAGRRAP